MRQYTPAYSRADVEDAIANSPSYSAALRRLGLRPVGGNFKTLRRLIAHYEISTDHFESIWTRRATYVPKCIPLEEVLVEHSTYNRGKLKSRLYEAGLKQRRCELCGQGELWNGQPMSLIIDHINGAGDDNRLENLQIVCPNCAATLDTHCGRRSKIDLNPRQCLHCGSEFRPKYSSHRYCSQLCGTHAGPGHDPHPERRKVERPPYGQLMAELAETNYCAVARKYEVSDNAVRKWVRWYEADIARRQPQPETGGEEPGSPGP
jgi:hypothetical protein